MSAFRPLFDLLFSLLTSNSSLLTPHYLVERLETIIELFPRYFGQLPALKLLPANDLEFFPKFNTPGGEWKKQMDFFHGRPHGRGFRIWDLGFRIWDLGCQGSTKYEPFVLSP